MLKYTENKRINEVNVDLTNAYGSINVRWQKSIFHIIKLKRTLNFNAR